jgi:hypothetical protein
MIWIILYALGIPLWLIIGAITSAVVSRRRFRREPGVFASKVRREPGAEAWPRAKSYGRWVHDVLIVHRGLALVRHAAMGVVTATGPLVVTDAKGLGDEPSSVSLHLDDGSTLDVAAARSDAELLPGPFTV